MRKYYCAAAGAALLLALSSINAEALTFKRTPTVSERVEIEIESFKHLLAENPLQVTERAEFTKGKMTTRIGPRVDFYQYFLGTLRKPWTYSVRDYQIMPIRVEYAENITHSYVSYLQKSTRTAYVDLMVKLENFRHDVFVERSGMDKTVRSVPVKVVLTLNWRMNKIRLLDRDNVDPGNARLAQFLRRVLVDKNVPITIDGSVRVIGDFGKGERPTASDLKSVEIRIVPKSINGILISDVQKGSKPSLTPVE